ncbi:alpha/beta fold hydrolase [Aquimarina algiphila]|uniref:alpha/beta fold hydrolase n=1 Tax=Aquimarina algiphila TaxID=2047982 RepID=UPI0024931F2F|nr:alpha/beta hydrolase [Aquimarina algiphila]
MKTKKILLGLLGLTLLSGCTRIDQQHKNSILIKTEPMKTKNKVVKIDDLSIFYREAGIQNKETILMLHGFPSSSHMYRDLIGQLSDKYHIIAPDYPGFGLSSIPPISEFEYTFEHITDIMNQFVDKLKLDGFYLLVQDYGGPIGFRIASQRPELIKGLIIQNANAYLEGFGEWGIKIGNYMKNNDIEALNTYKDHLMSLDGIKEQYLTGVSDTTKIDPISYLTDYAFLNRNHVKDIQSTMFNNYKTNFAKYSEWQEYFKMHQPPTLVVWGKNDKFFSKAGGKAFNKDLKNIESHFFNGGHFMLEEYAIEVGDLIDHFIKKQH